MKNLKKVLALVLVIAMVMGFAVSASATEFSDADTVAEQNATAVEVLNALNIINGFPDGTYRPTENVTRAQVAKMIAVAFNGGDESLNELYQNVTCGLTDIGGSWAEGYIKYCYATGIVNGYPDGTFKPENPVTGNELCQIMLNILGYEIDTTNTPWATAVMAKSSTIGLLKNVSTAAGSAAPRQEAAQIIFNALTLPIQESNAFGVLTDSNETILTKYLGGYTETVVVTGNEYASLTDDEVMDEGKTEVDGETTLNWSTTIDQIGSSYKIWAVKGGANNDDTVLFATEANNTVETFTAKANLTREISMKTDKATEYYVNFESSVTTSYEAIYRIDFAIKAPTKAKADEYVTALGTGAVPTQIGNSTEYMVTKTINAGKAVSTADLAVIKQIFAEAGQDDGYVYVGTQEKVDLSDRISYRTFLNSGDYVEKTETPVTVTANENGNYVKVIDNDGDGVAEYVLKTVYELSVVQSTGTKYTFANLDAIAAEKVSSEDELAAGDIVVVAAIDGVYYANLAEVVTDTIDAKGINYSKETVTCGETTYEQSGINPTSDNTAAQLNFNKSFLDTVFEFKLTDADTEMEYDFYLDNYGYVRAYTLSTNSNGLGLLTDAYYTTDGKTNTAKVDMVTATADEAEYTVYQRRSEVSAFINTDAHNYSDASTWGRLIGFQSSITDAQKLDGLHTFATNVAVYAGTADALMLKTPESYKITGYLTAELDMTNVSTLANQKYTTVNYSGTKTNIYATTSTVYYYVTKAGNDLKVTTWTGYRNAPVTLGADAIAYTVAHKALASANYTADVIVIEDNTQTDSASLVYDAYERNTGVVTTSIELTADGVDTAVVASEQKITWTKPAFYNSKKQEITENYASYGIYAASAEVDFSVSNRNYVYLTNGASFVPADVEIYTLAPAKGSTVYSVKALTGSVQKDDELIYVTDGKDIVYVIDATQSEDATILTLQANIELDNAKTYNTPVITFFGVSTVAGDLNTATGAAYGNAGEISKTVSYATAAAYTGINTLQVSGGTIVALNEGTTAITVGSVKASTAKKVYTGTIKGDNGKYYTFELTQAAAIATATLVDKAGDNAIVSATKTLTDSHGTYYKLTETTNDTIQDFLNKLTLSEDATVEWIMLSETKIPYSWTGMTVTDQDSAAKYAGVSMNEIVYVYAKVTSDDKSVVNYYMNQKYFDDYFCDHDADVTVTGVAAKGVEVDGTTIKIPKGLSYTAASDLITVADKDSSCTTTPSAVLSANKQSITVTATAKCTRGHNFSQTYTIEEYDPEIQLFWQVTPTSAAAGNVYVYAKANKAMLDPSDNTQVIAANAYLTMAQLEALFRNANVKDSEIALSINTSSEEFHPVTDRNFLPSVSISAAGANEAYTGAAMVLNFGADTFNGKTAGWLYSETTTVANNIYATLTINNTALNGLLANVSGKNNPTCAGITVNAG
jgi:hypothetical protein